MKQTINFSAFCDAFRDMDRNENYSYEGKRVLFDFLEEYEDSTGEEVELDVIALCCEYYENDVDTIIQDYSLEDDVEGMDEDDKRGFVENYLNDNTILVGETSSGFVYAAF